MEDKPRRSTYRNPSAEGHLAIHRDDPAADIELIGRDSTTRLVFTDPDQLQSIADFLGRFVLPLELASDGKGEEALDLIGQVSTEPFDLLYGMRAAAELLYRWEAESAGDDSGPQSSRTRVGRLCDEIQREGSASVAAALIGLTTIARLALHELGFHETLEFIMLRAEIDARRETDDVACP